LYKETISFSLSANNKAVEVEEVQQSSLSISLHIVVLGILELSQRAASWRKPSQTQNHHSIMIFFSIPIFGLLGLFLLVVYKFIIYPTFLSPISNIPNAHWSAPVSPLWILWTRYKCRENRDVHTAHLHHGPVVRLGPNEIHVNDLASLRTVYAGGFEKGEWYSIFDNYG
jgi:hypothetical protein